MNNDLTPKSTWQRWKESSATKIVKWLPENQKPRGIRSPHFWIIAASMAVLTLVYYAGHTPLAHFGPFLTCVYPHDIHRALFLLPIIYAAVAFRGWGALITSFLFLCVVLPRPFLCSPYAAPLLRPLLFVLFTAVLSLLIPILIDRMEKEQKAYAALKESQEQLRKSEERYRNTLDGMLEGCQIIGFDWRYLYLNDAAAEHGRRAKEGLLGRTMMEMYPGIEDTEMFAKLRYCMEKHTSHQMENLFTFPDGYQGWFELRIEPVPEGIFILSIDITERKQADERIRQQKEFLENMLESLTHPFYVVNADDYTVEIANSAARLSEPTRNPKCYAVTHRASKPCSSLEHPCPLEEVKKTKKPVTVEHIHYDKYGNEINVEVHGYPIFNKEGNVTQMITYSIDITERKQAEEQLIQAEKLTSLGQMAASIAHEVNNPLSGVLIYTQLLAKKVSADTLSKESAQKYLSKMDSELTRSTRLIRNLLDFARQSPPSLRLVDINDVVNRALDLAAHSAELQNIQVIKEFDSSLPKLTADFDQLQQVCTNLILNAIQAMPEGGRLTLRTSASDSLVKVEVEDTGCGISQENMRKLFAPFFTTKEKGKGVGLGLSVAYGIIQRHQGRIEVQSKEGEGTTFTVYLPLHHEEKG